MPWLLLFLHLSSLVRPPYCDQFEEEEENHHDHGIAAACDVQAIVMKVGYSRRQIRHGVLPLEEEEEVGRDYE